MKRELVCKFGSKLLNCHTFYELNSEVTSAIDQIFDSKSVRLVILNPRRTKMNVLKEG